MNRQEVRERLAELVRRALERPKPRKATKPTYASKLRRLEGKSQPRRHQGRRAGKARSATDKSERF